MKVYGANQLQFGFRTTTIRAPAIWGTRAIMDRRTRIPNVDILPDRQDVIGEQPHIDHLLEGLNGIGAKKGALRIFREFIASGLYDTSDLEDHEWDVKTDYGYKVRFNCRERGGYLYITATLISMEA